MQRTIFLSGFLTNPSLSSQYPYLWFRFKEEPARFPGLPHLIPPKGMNDYLFQFALLRERAFRETQNRELFRHLLICMELSGNHAESRALYEEILDRHPYCSLAWYNLGWAYAQLGPVEEALDAFEYAYITHPYFEEAYRACAELAVQHGFYRRALRCYTEMLGHVEADSEMLVCMGNCQLKLGNIREAKKLCRQALQLDPFNADAYYQLGACFAAEQDYRQAARWMREAVRTDDNSEEYHLALATVYGCQGQTQRALKHYWRAVELAPEEATAWLKLAECLMTTGEMLQAGEVLEQALENSTGADLLYCSAACKFLTGDRPAALRTLREALNVDLERQTSIFRWAPALRNDAEIVELLNSFQ